MGFVVHVVTKDGPGPGISVRPGCGPIPTKHKPAAARLKGGIVWRAVHTRGEVRCCSRASIRSSRPAECSPALRLATSKPSPGPDAMLAEIEPPAQLIGLCVECSTGVFVELSTASLECRYNVPQHRQTGDT